MLVLVTLNAGQGINLGPNFTLSANTGTVTPNTATLTQLLAGIYVTVDNAATSVTVTSLGNCTNSLVLNINAITTTTTTAAPTTTTTTTTAAPTTTTTTTTAAPTTTTTSTTTTSTTTTSTTTTSTTTTTTTAAPTTTTTTTTTLGAVDFDTSVGCEHGTSADGVAAMVNFSGGSGVYQASSITYSTQSGAENGTYVDVVSTQTFSGLSSGVTYWVALRDKNNPTNKIAHSFILTQCATTTTTTQPPITNNLVATCTGVTQSITISSFSGGDGTAYYANTSTYADALTASTSPTTLVSGGTRTYTNQPSGTRYIYITSGIRTTVSVGGQLSCTTTSTTTTTTTLAPVSFDTSAGCENGTSSDGTGAMVSFNGGSGVYQASDTTYSTQALALAGTYTDASVSRTFTGLSAGTYWVALRDKNDTNNKIAHSFTVTTCPTTTTTTQAPVTANISGSCTGTTQTITVNSFAGGDGSTYYASNTTYGDPASASSGAVSLVAGGTVSYSSQPSGTRYVKIASTIRTSVISGGQVCTTTTTTEAPKYYYNRYDLDIYCNTSNPVLVYSFTSYANGYYNIGGTVYYLSSTSAGSTSTQITATASSCSPSTTPVWTPQYSTCGLPYNGTCASLLVERDTNQYSATYLQYRVNGVVQGYSAPPNNSCNTTQTIGSQIGTWYTCSAGSVTATPVYINSNPCYPYSAIYYYNGTWNTVNPSNSAPSTSPSLSAVGLYWTCTGTDTVTNQTVNIDTNQCSSTYNQYYIDTTLYGVSDPSNSESDVSTSYAIYVCDSGATSYTKNYCKNIFSNGAQVLVNGTYYGYINGTAPINSGSATVATTGGTYCPVFYTDVLGCVDGEYYSVQGTYPLSLTITSNAFGGNQCAQTISTGNPSPNYPTTSVASGAQCDCP